MVCSVSRVHPKASRKRPHLPSAGQGTTFYNGGKIHRSEGKGVWRIFTTESDRVDKQVSFGSSMAASWNRSLDMIDKTRAGG